MFNWASPSPGLSTDPIPSAQGAESQPLLKKDLPCHCPPSSSSLGPGALSLPGWGNPWVPTTASLARCRPDPRASEAGQLGWCLVRQEPQSPRLFPLWYRGKVELRLALVDEDPGLQHPLHSEGSRDSPDLSGTDMALVEGVLYGKTAKGTRRQRPQLG